MAAQKPRNFASMRDDRVMAMARAHFNREFRSRKDAERALSKLAVKEQHALPKPKNPGSPARKPARTSRFNNELRGGVAPPSSAKLADAAPEAVKRYARMTTGLETKSKAQALTLMAKFAPTDVAKAAGGAIGHGGLKKSAGPTKAQLVEQYRKTFGAAPSSETKRTKASLASALESRETTMAKQPRKTLRATTAKAKMTKAERAEAKYQESLAAADRRQAAKSRADNAWAKASVDRFDAMSKTATPRIGDRASTQTKSQGVTPKPTATPKSSVPAVSPKPPAVAAPKLTPQMFAKPKGGGRLGTALALAAGAAAGVAAVMSSKANAAEPAKASPSPADPGAGLNSMQKIGAAQAGLGVAMMTAGGRVAAVGRVMALAGVGMTAVGFGKKADSGAFISDAAKAKAAAEPAPSARPAPATEKDERGSGPIEIPGYTRSDGVQVKSYTRQRN